jgi:hypothetical protein
VWNLFYDAASKVVVWGLILGAGLPAVFALGVRSTTLAQNPGGSGDAGVRPNLPGAAHRVLAVACFVLVVVAVALGIIVIVAAGLGEQVSFEHVYPALVPKS